jgi:hypothetical protein
VQDTTLNTGALRTKGVDINASYRTDLETSAWRTWAASAIVRRHLARQAGDPDAAGRHYFDCAG